MKEEIKWKQLNNIPTESTYILFPLSFTGKSEYDKDTVFNALPLSAKFILSAIYTANKISKNNAKLTYDYFVDLFGMSRETVAAALRALINLKIIKRIGQSNYRIMTDFNRKDFVTIDRYLLKREWETNGINKRLSRSRLLVLSLLARSATNPKTHGEFVSSHARIGVAVNMPRTTVGDSVRELVQVGAIKIIKDNVKSKRGCSKYLINPQLLTVQHIDRLGNQIKALFNNEQSSSDEITYDSPIHNFELDERAERLHKRLMLDTEYKNLIEIINQNNSEIFDELVKTKGKCEGQPKYEKLQIQKMQLQAKVETYLKVHNIDPSMFNGLLRII